MQQETVASHEDNVIGKIEVLDGFTSNECQDMTVFKI